MPALSAITAKDMLRALLDFPADGKVPHDDDTALVWIRMEGMGLIEAKSLHKACKECGTPRIISTYYKITQAGRAVIEIAQSDRDEF